MAQIAHHQTHGLYKIVIYVAKLLSSQMQLCGKRKQQLCLDKW